MEGIHNSIGKIRIRSLFISAIVMVAVLMVCFSLYYPQMAGLSDNADFARVMRPHGIIYADGQRKPFLFESRFRVNFKGSTRIEKLFNMLFTLNEPYFTTQNIFIKISLFLNLIANCLTGTDLHQYNIFWLGIIYVVLTVLAVFTLAIHLKTGKPAFEALFCLSSVLIFCDVAYITYFNSFYGEPVQFVALLWILASVSGIIGSEKRRFFFLVLYFLSVITFSGAKFTDIPMGVVFSVCALGFMPLFYGRKKERIVIPVFIAISLLFCFKFYNGVPDWMDTQTTYQSVFFGILKGSDNPEEDLKQLGLPEEYAALADTNAYMNHYKIDIKSLDFKEKFYDRISKSVVLKFYIKNPMRLIDKIRISLLNSSHIRPVYLSNYGEDHERLEFKKDIGLWSSLRLSLPFDSIYFVLGVFILSGGITLVWLINTLRRKRLRSPTFVGLLFFSAIIAMNLTNLVIPVIANGEADLQKHMFSYIMGFDLQVLILAFIILWHLPRLSARILAIIKSWFHGKVRYILPPAVILITLISIIIVISAQAPNDPLAPGSILYFGRYPDKSALSGKEQGSMPWIIINRKGSTLQLLAKEPVIRASFSKPAPIGDPNRKKYGSNLWSESDIRAWLHNEFPAYFTQEELNLVKPVTNWCILSAADKALAQRGDNDFFWTHLPSMVGYNAHKAYAMKVTDKFFLLDVAEFSNYVAKPGIETRPKEAYWLETPYYGNSSMVRVVAKDGYVYMKDACVDQIGVRPSVIIDISGAAVENGKITYLK